MPFEVRTFDCLSKQGNPEQLELMGFHQSYNGSRVPFRDRLEVCAEVTIPRLSIGTRADLTWAERHPNDAGAGGHRFDLQRIAFAVSGHLDELLSCKVSPRS